MIYLPYSKRISSGMTLLCSEYKITVIFPTQFTYLKVNKSLGIQASSCSFVSCGTAGFGPTSPLMYIWWKITLKVIVDLKLSLLIKAELNFI